MREKSSKIQKQEKMSSKNKNIKMFCLACSSASLCTKILNHGKIGQGFLQGLECVGLQLKRRDAANT